METHLKIEYKNTRKLLRTILVEQVVVGFVHMTSLDKFLKLPQMVFIQFLVTVQ